MNLVVPDKWLSLAGGMTGYSMILVLGATDTGKSTFIRFLAGEILRSGRTVALLNTDVGQADVGPPTAIAAAIPQSPFETYEELKAESLYFAGTTSPAGNRINCLVAIQRVHEFVKNRHLDCIIVNTTGWIYGPEARDYKHAKIVMLNPDLIIAFQNERELSSIIRPYKATSRPYLYCLPVPAEVKGRSLEERHRLRQEKYGRYFQGSSLHLINWRNVALLGICEEDLRHSEFLGRIVGLFDRTSECRGIGILRAVEPEETRLQIQAHPEALGELTQIHVGVSCIEEDSH